MYAFTAPSNEGLTLNAPQPCCHSNFRLCCPIQREELAFNFCIPSSQAYYRRELQQNMNVISGTADGQGGHTEILGSSDYVSPEFFPEFLRNHGRTGMCRDNAMHVLGGMGVRHSN
jgi:hypothetical protein